MTDNVKGDRLAVIRIEGMHCHKCEQTIQKALLANRGVHEVEVDFASSQASVLFDPVRVRVGQMIESIRRAGYKPMGLAPGSGGPARPAT